MLEQALSKNKIIIPERSFTFVSHALLWEMGVCGSHARYINDCVLARVMGKRVSCSWLFFYTNSDLDILHSDMLHSDMFEFCISLLHFTVLLRVHTSFTYHRFISFIYPCLSLAFTLVGLGLGFKKV
jgi:hypothetical protein